MEVFAASVCSKEHVSEVQRLILEISSLDLSILVLHSRIGT